MEHCLSPDLLMIECRNKNLYEIGKVWVKTLQARITSASPRRSFADFQTQHLMTSLYMTERAAENKRKTRFDPHHPEFIRQDEDEADEFEEDVGMSKTGAKRKQVRTDVRIPINRTVLIYQGYDSDSSQEGASKKA